MTRRSSAPLLVGVFVALTGLGVAATTIPLRECGSCHGLALHLTEKHRTPVAANIFRLDCPDCADRGRVSLYRAWRPRVAPQIGGTLRALKSPGTPDLLNALKPMALKEEMSADSFVELNGHPAQIGAQFVVAEENLYLILRAFYTSTFMPGESAAGFLLLHPDGRALDCVQMACSNREAELAAILLDTPGVDGAQLVVLPSPGWGKEVEPTISYRLYRWRRITRDGVTPGRGTPEKDGICRLRISGDRLELLTPEARR